jgi:nucleotide-binding universal stress UspA family protein
MMAQPSYVDQLGHELRADGISVAIQTRFEDTADELVSTAEDLNADLIVMPTRAGSGLIRLALGSVYVSTFRQAHVPVLVVSAACLAREPSHFPSRSRRLASTVD